MIWIKSLGVLTSYFQEYGFNLPGENASPHIHFQAKLYLWNAFWRRDNNINMQTLVNGRRLTNIGTFRAYIEAYLKNHAMIHQKLTFLVRQLAPSEKGLAIEIYVFTNITEWIAYEAIQADIFDHLLAVLAEFELQVFQNPTGKNFEQLGHHLI